MMVKPICLKYWGGVLAKDPRDPKQAKVRIFFGFADIEASDSTVEQNMRALAATVVRAVSLPPPVRSVGALPEGPPAPQRADKDNLSPHHVVNETTLDPATDVDLSDAQLENLDQEPAPAATKKVARPRKLPTYKLLGDLDLKPAGKKSLVEFFNEKKPGDQQEQVAVFVFYLAKVLNVGGVTANHLYTCFNGVSKKVPNDIQTVLRNTQSRKGWVDSTDPSNVKITVAGENFVGHDLPKKST